MARTADETASILSDLYDETFGRDSFEPFRITWPQLRTLAAVPRLNDNFLKEVSETLSETEHTLIHRMKSVTLLERKAVAPAGFSLQGYIDSGEFGYPVGGMIKLKALFAAKTAQHLYESGISANQKLTEKPDGKVLLEATVRDDVQLRWWLKGFGDNIEVVGPKRLREEFVEMALRLAGLYSSSTEIACVSGRID